MSYEELYKKYEDKKYIIIKIYGLEYVIKENNSKIIIYPVMYEKNYKEFNNLIELLNNYTIYNELLIDNMNRMKFVD